jgi:hypothetical protein
MRSLSAVGCSTRRHAEQTALSQTDTAAGLNFHKSHFCAAQGQMRDISQPGHHGGGEGDVAMGGGESPRSRDSMAGNFSTKRRVQGCLKLLSSCPVALCFLLGGCASNPLSATRCCGKDQSRPCRCHPSILTQQLPSKGIPLCTIELDGNRAIIELLAIVMFDATELIAPVSRTCFTHGTSTTHLFVDLELNSLS